MEEIKVLLETGGTSKGTCIELNRLRKNIDGSYTSSCFCSFSNRCEFIEDTKIWYNIKING